MKDEAEIRSEIGKTKEMIRYHSGEERKFADLETKQHHLSQMMKFHERLNVLWWVLGKEMI